MTSFKEEPALIKQSQVAVIIKKEEESSTQSTTLNDLLGIKPLVP